MTLAPASSHSWTFSQTSSAVSLSETISTRIGSAPAVIY